VNSGIPEVRRLVELRGAHRVVSLYLDLDPERFATPPARASQIRSLIDEATRDVERMQGLGHDEKVALRADLARIDSFLSSPEMSFKGARSLSIFCSGRDQLFETVALSRPVPAQVVIDRHPYVAPMVEVMHQRRWLVALVNRRSARLLSGSPDRLRERERFDDAVPGQHDQGGWSQANYGRSIEKDADDHLRAVADNLARRWRRERFDRLVLGGPWEVVARFEELLADELRERLVPERVEVDLGSASEAQIRTAVEEILRVDERRAERDALDRLASGVGAGGRATEGVSDTVQALNERRVQKLLVAPGFDGNAHRCPTCGLILVQGEDRCPADGSALEHVEHLREAVVEAAVVQDADVLVVGHHGSGAPREGIGALLRF
jgi:peptide chain release factor subunit 1